MFNKFTLPMLADVTKRVNRLDLKAEDYEEVRTGIRTLFTTGIDARGAILQQGQKLFRGVSYKDKPTSVDQLGAPPDHLVTGFQRCNGPGNPMFYCAAGISVIFYELKPKVKDKVYISRWSVDKDDFSIMYVSHPNHSELSDVISAIYQFFDTKFLEPIHADFSHRYKVTAAITDFLLREELYDSSPTIGGVQYTSAEYPGGKADNLAIFPAVVAESMSLDYVEEWVVEEVSDKGFHTKRVDFASRFDNGQIRWEGRTRTWRIPGKSAALFTRGPDGWVVTDENGKEIDPS